MWRQFLFSALAGTSCALLAALGPPSRVLAESRPAEARVSEPTQGRPHPAPAEPPAKRPPPPADPPAPPAPEVLPQQRAAAPRAPASTADAEVEAELRAARQELLALVARDSTDPGETTRVETAPPPAASAGTPPQSTAVAAPEPRKTAPEPPRKSAPEPSRSRLDWLEGLSPPDLPVRWDDRLVSLLDYYRSDARGRAQMRGLLTRKGRYIGLLRAKLRAAKLPEDLVYVAMVESAYDPRARSEAGALGMWQLMTAPASGYGLEMSKWVDERSSPTRSTDAALTYLRDLREELGSWPLAVAAFNMGHSALLRAMQKYNTNDFWLLSGLEAGLPYETVTYVAKISAYAIIGRNPARFGLGDVVPDPAIDSVSIALPGGTSLARIARAAGMEPDKLAELNPALKKARLPPDVKTWDVYFPKERIARFKAKWASQGHSPPSHRTHVLRLGERLSDVADMYDTTTPKLRALNDLDEESEVRAGFKLRVPDVDPIARPEPEVPTVGVLGDRFVYADRKRVFYRVAEGDELPEIAQFFRVTSDEILLWNRLAHECRLQRGMFLQLFVPQDADLSQTLVLAPNQVKTLTVGSEEFFDFHETQQNRKRVRYRVKPGDTLKSLSQRFDLSVGSIARINRFSRDTKLRPDSEIIVYVTKAK